MLITGATRDGIGWQVLDRVRDQGWWGMSIARPEAADRPASQLAGRQVDVRACACSNLAQIRSVPAALAAEARYPHRDLRVHGLGVTRATRHTTAQGLEESMVVDGVAPWLWTRELTPQLAAAAAARVVQVGSAGLAMGERDSAAPLQAPQPPLDFNAYFASERLNLHLRWAPQRQADEQGLKVTVNAVHPGLVGSELSRHLALEGGVHGVFERTAGRVLHQVAAGAPDETAAPSVAFALEAHLAALRGA